MGRAPDTWDAAASNEITQRSQSMPPFSKWVSKKQERMANAGGMNGLKKRDLAGKNKISKGQWLPESAKKKKK